MAMLSKRRWPEETELLRRLLGGFGFTEAVKWGKPCFMLEGKNVVLIQGFNEYIALMFFKGALLKDPKGVLARPGQHRSVRQLRFADAQEIRAARTVVKAYVAEAVELERAGAKLNLEDESEPTVPVELERAFKKVPGLKKALAALTPGRRRFYIHQISAAKQEKTREARVEAYVPLILQGLGLQERR
jgi:uncharacterized protein YdeI (YjbR/CyaY-like superfamily)